VLVDVQRLMGRPWRALVVDAQTGLGLLPGMRIMPTLNFSRIHISITTQSKPGPGRTRGYHSHPPRLGEPASHSRATVRRQDVARIVASDFAPGHSADGAGPGAGRGLSRRWCAVATQLPPGGSMIDSRVERQKPTSRGGSWRATRPMRWP